MNTVILNELTSAEFTFKLRTLISMYIELYICETWLVFVLNVLWIKLIIRQINVSQIWKLWDWLTGYKMKMSLMCMFIPFEIDAARTDTVITAIEFSRFYTCCIIHVGWSGFLHRNWLGSAYQQQPIRSASNRQSHGWPHQVRILFIKIISQYQSDNMINSFSYCYSVYCYINLDVSFHIAVSTLNNFELGLHLQNRGTNKLVMKHDCSFCCSGCVFWLLQWFCLL